MRQALFAIVLVAASFAGGAVVNGPGLRWAQNAAMSRLGFGDDDEVPRHDSRPDDPDATTEPDAGPTVGPSSEAPKTAASARIPVAPPAAPTPAAPRPADAPPAPLADEIPASPIPPLVLEPPAAEKVEETPKAPEVKAAAAEPPAARPAETPPPREMEPPALAASLPPAASPAQPAETPPPTSPKPGDAALERASLGDAPASARAATAPLPGEPADWAGVRNALRALGVTRYGTEGDARGRVRFFCLIPLAGRRAVGQHFEAEGDDELQAARSALKRVALWRATEADAGRAP
ncbi:MAG: hypothetical protein U0835_10975 [Isosphaeraceae bacterium]